MIHGLGIDTVEVQRIETMLERWRDRFTMRVFTGEEIAYCESRVNRAQHYACRLAAKEAFFKALGVPRASGISWQDIGVVSPESQRPYLILRGKARQWMEKMGIGVAHLSLTHTPLVGSAVVILERLQC
jgi:holo-[acyl-carrier protein] synthase